MATINFRIKPKNLKEKGLELIGESDLTFKVHTLNDPEAKLLFRLLKEFAFSPLGCLPKCEVMKTKEEKEMAKYLYEKFAMLFDLGLIRIDFRKDTPYPF